MSARVLGCKKSLGDYYIETHPIDCDANSIGKSFVQLVTIDSSILLTTWLILLFSHKEAYF